MSTDRENEMEKMSNWDGREVVIGALGRRVLATRAGPVRFEPVAAAREPLRVTGPSGATIDLFVHVAGPLTPKGWQIDLSYIDRVPERPTWWALVRVESRSSKPTIALVPDGWVRDNIRRHHAAYVAGYPNDERPITPASPHHTLEFSRVAEWVGRWEEIDRALGVTPPSRASGAPPARRSATGEPPPKSITG